MLLGKIEELRWQAVQQLKVADNLEELERIRISFLGKKGELTSIMREMAALTAQERPLIGQQANELRQFLEGELNQRLQEVQKRTQTAKLAEESVDVTIPGQAMVWGHRHPLQIVMDDIRTIFSGMGFSIEEGPEIETDYYNFEALNFPPDHPARDMQDSFYVWPEGLLRTHTSPVQARAMERLCPHVPIRFIAPGRVYRKDEMDSSHSLMFGQVEGLAVDRGISMADLKGVLDRFANEMFGAGQGVRFRPSFFPFTEPSAEVDVSCIICHGQGCRVCSHTGWLEIMGAGMVHPNVLAKAGYDPRQVTGFAFGMGLERIAMLRYGIDDIRLFYENDVRFLARF